MKHLILSLALAVPLAACATVPPGSVPVADGPVARTIERVLDRTVEMSTEDALDFTEEVQAAADVARAVLLMPDVSGTTLLVSLAPLMNLHDQLVMQRAMDGRLEQLEAEVYLEDTARLRSLFESVNIHAALVH